jgi:hypothetical protein
MPQYTNSNRRLSLDEAAIIVREISEIANILSVARLDSDPFHIFRSFWLNVRAGIRFYLSQ